MISELINSNDKKNIDELIKKYDAKINEFEASLFSNKETSDNLLTADKFNSLNSVLSIVNKNKGITYEKSLDIGLAISHEDRLINYRISITDHDLINEYMSMLHNRNNQLVYSIIMRFIYDEKNKQKTKNIKVIKKTKYFSSYITLENIYTRIKMDTEEELTKSEIDKLINVSDNFPTSKIQFRYKERASYEIIKDKNTFSVDLTRVRSSNEINRINNGLIKNEIEIECHINDKKTIYEQLCKIIEFIIKIVQESNYLMTKSMSSSILEKYMNVLNSNKNSFHGRNPEALEIHWLVNNLQNAYSVTDKADGDRFQLIVVDEKCYLINKSLTVTNIGLTIDKKFNNSVLDGEYIFIANKNKYIYMVFDCLTFGDINVREESSFIKRIQYADIIIENLNDMKFKYTKLIDDKLDVNNIEKIISYHEKNMISFYDDLDHYLNTKDNKVIVRRKYFMCANGIYNNEIFKYASKMWELFSTTNKMKCPYHLDGLIFQPLNQKYITDKSISKFSEYKFKPPNKNSIDFLIKMIIDDNTGKPKKVFDNSVDGIMKNKPYFICKLYVYTSINNVSKPILFKENEDLYECYLNLDENDIPRSLDGKQIYDNTIVEFYYDINVDLQRPFKWIPMKTRNDKTDEMHKFSKIFGNSEFVANKNWNSIKNPILSTDFDELANDKLYEKAFEKLQSRVDVNALRVEAKNDIYYQKKTKLVFEMGKFNNFVKSQIIYTYDNVYYSNNIKNKILDVAVGRGGDINKYYFTIAEYVVGTDIDLQTLHSTSNGPIFRYNKDKSGKPDFPPMFFIHADSTRLLNYDEQILALGQMSKNNADMFNKFFNGKTIFDRLNCSFAIHYFLKNDDTWNAFCDNINTYLREGGLFTFTTFDGDLVYKKLMDVDKYEEYYMDNGDKKILFGINKKYDNRDKKNDVGLCIDVHMSWISESDKYIPEYLVFPEFIIKSLLEKCNLELVETDLFENLYNNNKEFLEYGSKNETNINRKFFNDVYSFYKDGDLIEKTRIYSFLNRYYVFKKKETNLEEIRKKYYMAPKYNSETEKQNKNKNKYTKK